MGQLYPIRRLDMPMFPDNLSIREKAKWLRKEWGLGEHPIQDMVKLLEEHGFYLFTVELNEKKIDGYSQMIGNVPIIVLNRNKGTLERRQFSIAHELGHLILHCNLEVETEVLMANFFGSPEYENLGMNSVDLEMIDKCARVLANNLPGYVFYDLSPRKIDELVRENKQFVLNEGRLCYRGKKINREKYNTIYAKNISQKISEIVDQFFQLHLYEKQIKRLMQVQV